MIIVAEHNAAARDLRAKREVVAEAMLPIPGEAQEIEIELFRLLDREDAQDRDRLPELRRFAHSAAC